MTRQDWSADTSWDEVKARARGRRRFNVTQRFRANARRVKVARRLAVLQQEAWHRFDRGESTLPPSWIPRGTIAQLAKEFGVNRQTISADIAAIDSWPAPTPPAPPRKKLRDPRFPWAYSRPRLTTLPRRITVRLPEALYQELIVKGDPVHLVRKAIETFLDSGSHHSRDDCALVVAEMCDADTIARLIKTAERLKRPLVEVLASLLLVGSRKET
jgi:hypothetical protein